MPEEAPLQPGNDAMPDEAPPQPEACDATAAVAAWLERHPHVVHGRYTQRRRLFLEAACRDPQRRSTLESRLLVSGAYQRARGNIGRHVSRQREPDPCLVYSPSQAAPSPGSNGNVVEDERRAAASPVPARQLARGPSALFAGIHRVFQQQGDAVTSLAFARDQAQLLAVASRNGVVVLYPTAKDGMAQRLMGHRGAVLHVDFSAGNEYLASSSEDATVRVWRVDNGSCLREFPLLATAICTLTFHPANSNLLLLDGDRPGLACANVSTGKDAARCLNAGEVVAAAFDFSGAVIFAATRSGTINILQLKAAQRWKLTLWRSVAITDNHRDVDGPEPAPNAVTYTPWLKDFGGPALLVPCTDRTIYIFSWQGRTGSPDPTWKERLLEAKSASGLSRRLVLRLPTPAGPRRWPGSAAFCGQGASHVVCSEGDNTLSIVNLGTLRVADALSAHAERISAVRASSGGDLLASADTSGCVILWGTNPPRADSSSTQGPDCDFERQPDYDSVAE
eukprot:gnl/TRDRNA2_/TRDRNA2_201137_c0_seq1.p1 gnl/TRDRNA2_/TRDRNA2_201137_c0~~gnl/TRDRNA2_/TRDRNA2_201137_c0_seq1.p1  ORF type:complete len:508 (-),score=70.38 gnl/TRDRNA2_/TRDRNA2_201137_c0_seq1:21-1544(-)